MAKNVAEKTAERRAGKKTHKKRLINKQKKNQRSNLLIRLNDKQLESLLIREMVVSYNDENKISLEEKENEKRNKYVVHLKKLYQSYKFEECLKYGLENIEKVKKKNYIGKIEFLKIIGNVYFYMEYYKYSSLTYLLLSKYLNKVPHVHKIEVCYNSGIVFMKYFLESNDISYYLNAKRSFTCSLLFNEKGSKHFNEIIYLNTIHILKKHFSLNVRINEQSLQDQIENFSYGSSELCFKQNLYLVSSRKTDKGEGEESVHQADTYSSSCIHHGASTISDEDEMIEKKNDTSKEEQGNVRNNNFNYSDDISVFDNTLDRCDFLSKKSILLYRKTKKNDMEKKQSYVKMSSMHLGEQNNNNNISCKTDMKHKSLEEMNKSTVFRNNLNNFFLKNSVNSFFKNVPNPIAKSSSHNILKNYPTNALSHSRSVALARSSISLVPSPVNTSSPSPANTPSSMPTNFPSPASGNVSLHSPNISLARHSCSVAPTTGISLARVPRSLSPSSSVILAHSPRSVPPSPKSMCNVGVNHFFSNPPGNTLNSSSSKPHSNGPSTVFSNSHTMFMNNSSAAYGSTYQTNVQSKPLINCENAHHPQFMQNSDLQFVNTGTSQYSSIATPQFVNIAPPQYVNITQPQHVNIIPTQYINFASPPYVSISSTNPQDNPRGNIRDASEDAFVTNRTREDILDVRANILTNSHNCLETNPPIDHSSCPMPNPPINPRINFVNNTSTNFVKNPQIYLVNNSPVYLMNSAPIHTTNSAPVHMINSAPVDMINNAPVDKINSSPVDKINSAPVDKINSAPVDMINSTSVDQVNNAPVDHMKSAPVEHMNSFMISHQSNTPISRQSCSEIKPNDSQVNAQEKNPPNFINSSENSLVQSFPMKRGLHEKSIIKCMRRNIDENVEEQGIKKEYELCESRLAEENEVVEDEELLTKKRRNKSHNEHVTMLYDNNIGISDNVSYSMVDKNNSLDKFSRNDKDGKEHSLSNKVRNINLLCNKKGRKRKYSLKRKKMDDLFSKTILQEYGDMSVSSRVSNVCKEYANMLTNELYNIYENRKEKNRIKQVLKRKIFSELFNDLYEICKRKNFDLIVEFVDEYDCGKRQLEKACLGIVNVKQLGYTHNECTNDVQTKIKAHLYVDKKESIKRVATHGGGSELFRLEQTARKKKLLGRRIEYSVRSRKSILFKHARNKNMYAEGKVHLSRKKDKNMEVPRKGKKDEENKKTKESMWKGKEKGKEFMYNHFVNLYRDVKNEMDYVYSKFNTVDEKYSKEKREIEELIFLNMNKINKKRIRDKVKKLSSYNNSILSNVADKLVDDIDELFFLKNYCRVLKCVKKKESIKHIYYLYENMYAIDKFDHINSSNIFNLSHFIIDILLLNNIKEKNYLKKKIKKMEYSRTNYYLYNDDSPLYTIFKNILRRTSTYKDGVTWDEYENHMPPSNIKKKRKIAEMEEQNGGYSNVKFSSTTTVNNSDSNSCMHHKKGESEELRELEERRDTEEAREHEKPHDLEKTNYLEKPREPDESVDHAVPHDHNDANRHGIILNSKILDECSKKGDNVIVSETHNREGIKEDLGSKCNFPKDNVNNILTNDLISLCSSTLFDGSNLKRISTLSSNYNCEKEKLYAEIKRGQSEFFHNIETFYEHMNTSHMNSNTRKKIEEMTLMLFYHYCNCNVNKVNDVIFRVFFFFTHNNVINKKNAHEYITFLKLYHLYIIHLKSKSQHFFYHNVEKDSKDIKDRGIKKKKMNTIMHQDFATHFENCENIIYCHLHMLKLVYKCYLNKLKKKHSYDNINLEKIMNRIFSLLNCLLVRHSYNRENGKIRPRVLFLFMQFLYINSKYYFKNVTFFLDKYDINYLVKSDSGSFCKANSERSDNCEFFETVNESLSPSEHMGDGEEEAEEQAEETEEEGAEEEVENECVAQSNDPIKGNDLHVKGPHIVRTRRENVKKRSAEAEEEMGKEEERVKRKQLTEEAQNQGEEREDKQMEKKHCGEKKKRRGGLKGYHESNIEKFKIVFTKLDENVNITFSSFLKCYNKCFLILNLKLYENDTLKKSVLRKVKRITHFCNSLYSILKIKKLPISKNNNFVFDEVNYNLYNKDIFKKPSFFNVLSEDMYIYKMYSHNRNYIMEKRVHKTHNEGGVHISNENDLLEILLSYAVIDKEKYAREKIKKDRKFFITLVYSYQYIKKCICKELKKNSILSLYKRAKELDENFNSSIDYLHSLFDSRLCMLLIDYELQNIIMEFISGCMGYIMEQEKGKNKWIWKDKSTCFTLIKKVMKIYNMIFSIFYLRLNSFSEQHTNRLYKILSRKMNVFSYNDKATWNTLNIFNFVNYRYGCSYNFLNHVFTSFHVFINGLLKTDANVLVDKKCIGQNGNIGKRKHGEEKDQGEGNAKTLNTLDHVQKRIERKKKNRKKQYGRRSDEREKRNCVSGVTFRRGKIYRIINEVYKKVTINGKFKIKDSMLEKKLGKKMNKYYSLFMGEKKKTQKGKKKNQLGKSWKYFMVKKNLNNSNSICSFITNAEGDSTKKQTRRSKSEHIEKCYFGMNKKEKKSHSTCYENVEYIKKYSMQCLSVCSFDNKENDKHMLREKMFEEKLFKYTNMNKQILKNYKKLKNIKMKLKQKMNSTCFLKYIPMINKSYKNKIYTSLCCTYSHILFILLSILYIENYNILHLRKNQDFFMNYDIYNTYYIFLHMSSSIILLLSSPLRTHLHFYPSVSLIRNQYFKKKDNYTQNARNSSTSTSRGKNVSQNIEKLSDYENKKEDILPNVDNNQVYVSSPFMRKLSFEEKQFASFSSTRKKTTPILVCDKLENVGKESRRVYGIYLETLLSFSSINILLITRKRHSKNSKIKKNKYIFTFCNLIETLLQNSMFFMDLFINCKNRGDVLEMNDIFLKLNKVCKENNNMNDFISMKQSLIYHTLFKYVIQDEYINYFNIGECELYNINKCYMNLFYFSLNILLTTFNSDISIHLERSLYNISHFDHKNLYYDVILSNVKKVIRHMKDSNKASFNCIYPCILYYLSRYRNGSQAGRFLGSANLEPVKNAAPVADLAPVKGVTPEEEEGQGNVPPVVTTPKDEITSHVYNNANMCITLGENSKKDTKMDIVRGMHFNGHVKKETSKQCSVEHCGDINEMYNLKGTPRRRYKIFFCQEEEKRNFSKNKTVSSIVYDMFAPYIDVKNVKVYNRTYQNNHSINSLLNICFSFLFNNFLFLKSVYPFDILPKDKNENEIVNGKKIKTTNYTLDIFNMKMGKIKAVELFLSLYIHKYMQSICLDVRKQVDYNIYMNQFFWISYQRNISINRKDYLYLNYSFSNVYYKFNDYNVLQFLVNFKRSKSEGKVTPKEERCRRRMNRGEQSFTELRIPKLYFSLYKNPIKREFMMSFVKMFEKLISLEEEISSDYTDPLTYNIYLDYMKDLFLNDDYYYVGFHDYVKSVYLEEYKRSFKIEDVDCYMRELNELNPFKIREDVRKRFKDDIDKNYLLLVVKRRTCKQTNCDKYKWKDGGNEKCASTSTKYYPVLGEKTNTLRSFKKCNRNVCTVGNKINQLGYIYGNDNDDKWDSEKRRENTIFHPNYPNDGMEKSCIKGKIRVKLNNNPYYFKDIYRRYKIDLFSLINKKNIDYFELVKILNRKHYNHFSNMFFGSFIYIMSEVKYDYNKQYNFNIQKIMDKLNIGLKASFYNNKNIILYYYIFQQYFHLYKFLEHKYISELVLSEYLCLNISMKLVNNELYNTDLYKIYCFLKFLYIRNTLKHADILLNFLIYIYYKYFIYHYKGKDNKFNHFIDLFLSIHEESYNNSLITTECKVKESTSEKGFTKDPFFWKSGPIVNHSKISLTWREQGHAVINTFGKEESGTTAIDGKDRNGNVLTKKRGNDLTVQRDEHRRNPDNRKYYQERNNYYLVLSNSQNRYMHLLFCKIVTNFIKSKIQIMNAKNLFDNLNFYISSYVKYSLFYTFEEKNNGFLNALNYKYSFYNFKTIKENFKICIYVKNVYLKKNMFNSNILSFLNIECDKKRKAMNRRRRRRRREKDTFKTFLQESVHNSTILPKCHEVNNSKLISECTVKDNLEDIKKNNKEEKDISYTENGSIEEEKNKERDNNKRGITEQEKESNPQLNKVYAEEEHVKLGEHLPRDGQRGNEKEETAENALEKIDRVEEGDRKTKLEETSEYAEFEQKICNYRSKNSIDRGSNYSELEDSAEMRKERTDLEDRKKDLNDEMQVNVGQVKIKKEEISSENTNASLETLNKAQFLRNMFFKKRNSKKISKKYYFSILKFYLKNNVHGYFIDSKECAKLGEKSIYLIFLFLGKIFNFLFNSLLSSVHDEEFNKQKRIGLVISERNKNKSQNFDESYSYDELLLHFILISMCHYADSVIFLSICFLDVHQLGSANVGNNALGSVHTKREGKVGSLVGEEVYGEEEQEKCEEDHNDRGHQGEDKNEVKASSNGEKHDNSVKKVALGDMVKDIKGSMEKNDGDNGSCDGHGGVEDDPDGGTDDHHSGAYNRDGARVDRDEPHGECYYNDQRSDSGTDFRKTNFILKPCFVNTNNYYVFRKRALDIFNNDKESAKMIIPLYKLLVTRLKICLYYPKYFFLACLFNYKYDTKLSNIILTCVKDKKFLSHHIKYYICEVKKREKNLPLWIGKDNHNEIAKGFDITEEPMNIEKINMLTSNVKDDTKKNDEDGKNVAVNKTCEKGSNVNETRNCTDNGENGSSRKRKKAKKTTACINYYADYHECNNLNKFRFNDWNNSLSNTELEEVIYSDVEGAEKVQCDHNSVKEFNLLNDDSVGIHQKVMNNALDKCNYENDEHCNAQYEMMCDVYETEIGANKINELNLDNYKLKVLIKNIEIKYEDVVNDIIDGLHFLSENKNCGNYNSQAAYHLCIYYFMRKNYVKCIQYMKIFVIKGTFKIWQIDPLNHDYYNLYCKRIQRSEFCLIKYFTIVLEVSKNVLKNVLYRINEEISAENGKLSKEVHRGNAQSMVDRFLLEQRVLVIKREQAKMEEELESNERGENMGDVKTGEAKTGEAKTDEAIATLEKENHIDVKEKLSDNGNTSEKKNSTTVTPDSLGDPREEKFSKYENKWMYLGFDHLDNLNEIYDILKIMFEIYIYIGKTIKRFNDYNVLEEATVIYGYNISSINIMFKIITEHLCFIFEVLSYFTPHVLAFPIILLFGNGTSSIISSSLVNTDENVIMNNHCLYSYLKKGLSKEELIYNTSSASMDLRIFRLFREFLANKSATMPPNLSARMHNVFLLLCKKILYYQKSEHEMIQNMSNYYNNGKKKKKDGIIKFVENALNNDNKTNLSYFLYLFKNGKLLNCTNYLNCESIKFLTSKLIYNSECTDINKNSQLIKLDVKNEDKPYNHKDKENVVYTSNLSNDLNNETVTSTLNNIDTLDEQKNKEFIMYYIKLNNDKIICLYDDFEIFNNIKTKNEALICVNSMLADKNAALKKGDHSNLKKKKHADSSIPDVRNSIRERDLRRLNREKKREN
ncbi:hypothetical protein, conserved [Plasmodium ovale curtisi]|uniref:Uncharacterized protein n=1 Tax=Plasmodium ovale curtisi TaxID=864141 RepID=A0A1A8WY98_PLAOA|nr:hypothetical protein, conserved [Plasmodium ovale curtisi]